MDGFQEVVNSAWKRPVTTTSAIRRLHVKLSRVAKDLKKWHKKNFSDLRMQMAVAKEVIGRLDVAEEGRPLTAHERGLRVSLRARIQGIASIIKIRIRQRARLTNIRLGDANLRLFHMRAKGRRRKNFIQNLRTDSGLAITHEEKQNALHTHFREFLGTAVPRTAALSWESLGYAARDLSALEAPFLMEELKSAVFDLPMEKSARPGWLHRFILSPLLGHYQWGSPCCHDAAG